MLHFSNLDIRRAKPGFSEAYYRLFESLDTLVPVILQRHNMGEAEQFQLLDGETNAVISFTTPQNAFVLKLAPNDDLATEVYWYEKVQRAQLASVALVAHDLTKTHVPYMYIIMMHSSGYDLRNATSTHQRAAGIAVGHYLRQLHALPAGGFGALAADHAWTHTDSVTPIHDSLLRSGVTYWKDTLFSPFEIANVENLLLQPHMQVMSPALLHGDVGLPNVLFQVENTQLTLTAMIDPGEIVGGDPMLDLAIATNDFDAFGAGVLHGYTQQQPLTEEEHYRLRVLQLCTLYWSSCWHYATQRDYTRPLHHFRTVFQELMP